MKGKRKQPRSLALIAFGIVVSGGGQAFADDARPVSTLPLAETRPLDPAGDVVAQALKALQDRKGDIALAFMTDKQQNSFRRDAAFYLRTLRLHQHALYDHHTFRVLATEHQGIVAIHKIELKSRDGRTALAIFRLIQQDDGVWRIDHVGIVDDTDERGA
jgi:Domain of unknown function (DUF4864)